MHSDNFMIVNPYALRQLHACPTVHAYVTGNNTIKFYLLSGRGSFLTVYKALSEMTQAQSKIYDEALANDRARIPMRFLG